MSITVNNRKIKSLPEQVAENAKNIKGLELYHYNFALEANGGDDYVYFDVYSHIEKSEEEFDDDIQDVLSFLTAANVKRVSVGGYSDSVSASIIYIEVSANEITGHCSDGSTIAFIANFMACSAIITKVM